MAYRSFIVPRNIFYGPGALQSLTTIPMKRALIVTDTGVCALGMVDRVKQMLQDCKVEVSVFDRVEADPSRDTACRILSLAQDFQPDTFIGLGGGSPIDAGKAGWVFYEHPDLASGSLFDIQRELPNRVLRRKARYIGIPTTSGTGSEVTGAMVITDRAEKPPLKIGAISPHLRPDAAIADPELAASMPPAVTANTGFDALVHAVECYVLMPPIVLIDSLAIGAARMIWEWLPRAVANGRDMLARDNMHLAALQAGMAFANGRLGVVHNLSHELSAILGIAHGRANALMLCPSFAFLYPTHRARLSSLAESLGFSGRSDRTRVTNLLAGLDELKQRVEIPLAMKAGLAEATFTAQLGSLVDSYDIYMSHRPQPLSFEEKRAQGWPVSADEVKELFLHAWNGTRAEIK
ncbi:MAG: iron-containing alcohol dehydrogenase [Dehalococcoidales bacterium]|nr:iron-containing alcohol dehydrogenase [Dehalococcoidales bacterium]